MKNQIVWAAVAAMFFSPLVAKEQSYSERFQQWGKKHQSSGLFDRSQSAKAVTESDLLLQLDKEGRQKYRNLPPKAQKEVLQEINHSKSKNYDRLIDEAVKNQRLSVEKNQARMLHNGMDRIQVQK